MSRRIDLDSQDIGMPVHCRQNYCVKEQEINQLTEAILSGESRPFSLLAHSAELRPRWKSVKIAGAHCQVAPQKRVHKSCKPPAMMD